jgi:outer membrane receptor protein involved in Fe transport
MSSPAFDFTPIISMITRRFVLYPAARFGYDGRLAFPPKFMTLPRSNAIALAVLSTLAWPALAQTAKKPVPAPAESIVTVTGNRPANRIDRQSYDVKSDINSTNGSAADALNNVPSVAVDPDGTVTLRGSTNVQIMVDGKPSAMLQGENRGAALNAMPADSIESIEVINNPGAQFGNEAGGGGPILNLVMRRNRKAGGFGGLNANAGTGGRYNTSLSGSYNEGLLGVQGGFNIRHDGRNSTGSAARVRIDPVTGAAIGSTQDTHSDGLTDSTGFNYGLTYNLSDKDTVAASLAYALRSNDQRSGDHYVQPGSDYQRSTGNRGTNESFTWGGSYEHKGAISGEVARLDLRVSSTKNANDSAYANAYLIRPAGASDTLSRQRYRTENRIADLTGDYERPVESAFLKLGFKIATNANDFDTAYANIDPLTLAATPFAARSNRFALDETTLALYGTYQMRLNERWGVLAGLRSEYTHMDIAQITEAVEASNNYINYIPSAFVSYKASDDTNLRFGYARRIRRPGAGDLNPFVVYRDEFNVSSGNPNLKPTRTDSFELGYESRFGALNTNLRGYYRKDSGLISERKVFISDTVILTTRDNAGSNQSGGLEFNLGGKLLPKLNFNANGNLAYMEQRIFGLQSTSGTTRSATSLSGHVRAGYQLSEQDQLQLALNAQGKTLAGQGYRQPNATANISYRRTLTPALSMLVNVTDVFDSNKIETITDTDLLKETNVRRSTGRLVYIGLSYRLGGVGPSVGRRGPVRPGGERPMQRPPAQD